MDRPKQVIIEEAHAASPCITSLIEAQSDPRVYWVDGTHCDVSLETASRARVFAATLGALLPPIDAVKQINFGLPPQRAAVAQYHEHHLICARLAYATMHRHLAAGKARLRRLTSRPLLRVQNVVAKRRVSRLLARPSDTIQGTISQTALDTSAATFKINSTDGSCDSIAKQSGVLQTAVEGHCVFVSS